MHPCPWLLQHLFHASMSMVAAGELAPGSTFLAGACCAGAAAAGLLSPDPFFALPAFFSFLGAASFFLPKISLYFFAIKLGFFGAHVNFANDRLELLLVDTSKEPSVNIGVLVAEGINHNMFVEHDHVASNRNVSKGNSLTYKESFGHKVVVEQLHGTFDGFFGLVACIMVELIHAQGWVDPSACCWLQNTVSKRHPVKNMGRVLTPFQGVI